MAARMILVRCLLCMSWRSRTEHTHTHTHTHAHAHTHTHSRIHTKMQRDNGRAEAEKGRRWHGMA